jgi:hypothetical protein
MRGREPDESDSPEPAGRAEAEQERFWDAVQREIETMDWADFQQFLAANELPYEPRPSFEVRLRQRLRALISRKH